MHDWSNVAGMQPMCKCISISNILCGAQSCLILCDPIDCSPLGSSAHGVFKTRLWEWVAISYTRGSSWPRDGICISCISCIGRWILCSFPSGSDGKESACNVGDPGSISGLGRSPGEGNGNPLQYSCLENPMNERAWRATVHGVTKSWTRLSN